MSTSGNLTFSSLSFYFAGRTIFKACAFKTFLSLESSFSIVEKKPSRGKHYPNKVVGSVRLHGNI